MASTSLEGLCTVACWLTDDGKVISNDPNVVNKQSKINITTAPTGAVSGMVGGGNVLNIGYPPQSIPSIPPMMPSMMPMMHPMMSIPSMNPMLNPMMPRGFGPPMMPIYPGQFPMMDPNMMMMGYCDPRLLGINQTNGKKTGKVS